MYAWIATRREGREKVVSSILNYIEPMYLNCYLLAIS